MHTALKLLAIFASIALVSAEAGDYEEENDVLVLDADTYEDAIKEFDPLLVEFYAPWCGHCQRLAPEYEKAAKALKAKGIRIAKIDAEQPQNKELREKIGVKSYPTLKWVVGGKATDYAGPRTGKGIVKWISKRAGSPATTIKSEAEFVEFVAQNDAAAVGFFADETSKAGKAFMKTAAGLDTVSFALVTDPAVAQAAGADMESLKLYKENGAEELTFPGKPRKIAMTKWIKENQLPLVIPFTEENADAIFGSPIKTHFLLFADAEHSDAVSGFREVAANNKGKLLFVIVDSQQSNVMQFFKLTPSDLPTAYIADMPEGGQMKRYQIEEKVLNEESLADFASGFVAGNLKRSLKSEPAQPDDLEHDVAVLRGSTIAEVTGDAFKDVLVEFYAPWCGHCKQLAPVYEKVGAAFADDDSVIIAKMDATENDIPPEMEGVDVKGFPTLFFFPAGGEGRVYEGPRDEAGMIAWVKKNAQAARDSGDL